jgi:hypothetical protein
MPGSQEAAQIAVTIARELQASLAEEAVLTHAYRDGF